MNSFSIHPFIRAWAAAALASLIVLASWQAQALSLGRSRGAVLLGRALDVQVLASVEATEAMPEPSCFVAEVFYGESRVPSGAVQIGVDRSNATEVRVQVRSSRAVDEPVVTVYLRSSCGGNSSRRYVLLSDSPTEQDSPPALNTQSPRIVPPVIAPTAPTAPVAAPSMAAPRATGVTEQDQQVSQAARQQRAQAIKTERQARKEQRLAERRAKQGQANAQVNVPSVVKLAPSGVSQSLSSQTSKAQTLPAEKRPKLQLDLLDISASPGALRSSDEMLTLPTTDEATRDRARALWRSLSGGSEAAAQDAQTLSNLQVQVKQSLDQTKKQSSEITALRSELEVAKRGRYLNPLTLGLGLLALLAIAAAAIFARRGGLAGLADAPWWRSKNEKRSEVDELALWEHIDPKHTPDLKTSRTAASVATSSSKIALNPDIEKSTTSNSSTGAAALPLGWSAGRTASSSQLPSEFLTSSGPQTNSSFTAGVGSTQRLSSEEIAENLKTAAAVQVKREPVVPIKKAATGRREARNSDFDNSLYSGYANSRVADAEELFDIQEQADFFLSLGQPEQAIEVLTNHISDNVETSAIAYMDLFDIYHKLNRAEDYEALREDFNRIFNAQVPEFGNYSASSRGLEDYPQALQAIQELWPSTGVQELIEVSIFRKPDASAKPFDMMAYRELMMLYSLAKELGESGFAHVQIKATQANSAVSLSTATQTDLGQLDPLNPQNPLESFGGSVGAIELVFSPSAPPDVIVDDKLQSSDPTGLVDISQLDGDNALDFDLSETQDLSKLRIKPSPKT